MEDYKNARVGVVMGGPSSEREVSLDSGAGVHRALLELGYNAIAIDWKPGTLLSNLLRDAAIDVVWNALHGTLGEDGAVQGLLTCLGLPYTGSGIAASAIAMDKVRSKVFFEQLGLVVSQSVTVLDDAEFAERADQVPLPVVVKPACEGSSVGVSLVYKRELLASAVANAQRPGLPAIIERYVPGAEVAVSVLDGAALGSVEIRPNAEFYDYEAKYKRDDTVYLVPPELPASVIAEIEDRALSAHNALGCENYSRVDFIVERRTHCPYLIEVNTLPGMTSHSLLPKAAAYAGMSYPELCRRILLGAHH